MMTAAPRKKRPVEHLQSKVTVDRVILDLLAPHAAARGISVHHLVRNILYSVADDGLVDAILDDEQATHSVASQGHAPAGCRALPQDGL